VQSFLNEAVYFAGGDSDQPANFGERDAALKNPSAATRNGDAESFRELGN